MAQSWKVGCYSFGVINGSIVNGAIASAYVAVATLFGLPALSQIAPDATLGKESSVVTPSSNLRGAPGILIQGGAARGANLFQSFAEFNVGAAQRVYFANPAGIANILSRVTGANPSNILGTLGVNGAANLFLLNPNGIVFGSNARLDVAGSFVASTATSLTFGNGTSFSATNPEPPPLLAVSLNPGLQYGTNYRGTLTNAGTLAVGNGQTLALAGSTVSSTGALIAPGGLVQVLGDRISLLDNARIDVSGVGGGGTVLIGGDFQGKGQVPNASQTFVAPGATIAADALTYGNGGKVVVWANNTTRFDGTISARGGANSGNGGAVEISGKQTLNFNGHVDTSAASGSFGTLLLDPTDFEVNASNVSSIENSPTLVTITADNDITFNAPIQMVYTGVGLTALAGNNIAVNNTISTISGPVTLTAQRGNIAINGALIDTTSVPGNFAGSIAISAGNQVTISNSRLIAKSIVDTSDAGTDFTTIQIFGQSVNIDQSYISASNAGSGFAGDVAISAQNEVNIVNSKGQTLVENGVIFPQPPGIFSQGNQGQILIGESRYFTFSPTVVNINNSQLVTNNLSTDPAAQLNTGNISIHAINSISLTNATSLSSSTVSRGNAGNVTLTTDNGSVVLSNKSVIFDNIEPSGVGNGGNIFIQTGTLSLSNASQLQALVRGGGNGNAGIVSIQASDSVSLLDGSGIFSTIEQNGISRNFNQVAGGVFDALLSESSQPITGSIFIETGSLSLNNSALTASTRGQGNAGAVVVLASGDVSLTNHSAILSAVYDTAEGDAGGIILGARNFLADNVSFLTTETNGQGDAGIIFVAVNKLISLNNGSGILSQVDKGSQDAGGIFLRSNSLHARHGSGMSVDNNGSGLAGDISITSRGIWLDDQSTISAQSNSGQGGNIFLKTLALILGRSSDVSATSGTQRAGGDGGNIAIGTGTLTIALGRRQDGQFVASSAFDGITLLVAGKTFSDNNILAEAFNGTGGNIRINASRLQTIAERPDLFTRNDISTASSLGVNGSTVINTLDVFPSLKANPLPARYDVPRVAEGCDPRTRQESSRFIVTGRGGVPANPSEVLNQDTIVGGSSPTSSNPPPPVAEVNAIVPARGFIQNANGTVQLTAYVTDPAVSVLPNPLLPSAPTCYAP